MLGAARGTWTRGPDPGRQDRAESLANPTRPQEEWVRNAASLSVISLEPALPVAAAQERDAERSQFPAGEAAGDDRVLLH